MNTKQIVKEILLVFAIIGTSLIGLIGIIYLAIYLLNKFLH